MSKIFTYEKIVESVYLKSTDENEDIVEKFDYEVDEESLLDGVVDLVYKDCFHNDNLEDSEEYELSVKQGIKKWIYYLDNLDDLVKEYKKELKEMFEQEAFESLD